MNYFTIIDSPLGELLLLSDGKNLTGLYTCNLYAVAGNSVTVDLPGVRSIKPVQEDQLPIFITTQAQLNEYFEGKRRDFDLPVKLTGTPFQEQVWQALLTTNHGKCVTYGQIARAIGHPSASRAVGAAIGRNPVCIIVPCHRVIGADGSLTGFAGGMDRKKFLLELESQATTAKQLQFAK